MNRLIAGVGLAALVSLGTQAAAQTVVTLMPTADTYTQQGTPTTNYGAQSTVLIRRDSAGTLTRGGYFQFDLSGLPTGTITSAVLRLFGSQDQGGAGITIKTHGGTATTPWSETALTYNNAATLSGVDFNSTSLATITVSPPPAAWYSWNVTSYVAGRRSAGHATIGVGYTTTNTYRSTFNSREATNNRPELVVTVGSSPPPASSATNLVAGKILSSNGSNTSGNFAAANANDANTTTYWEGTANAYPNELTVDLGSNTSVDNAVLKINPEWPSRNQTLSVLGRTDNGMLQTLAPLATYTFNPSTNNVVIIPFVAVSVRYVTLRFTANTAATGAQLAEFEIRPAGQTYGASVPYTTYQAEAGTHNGTLIAGSRAWGQLSSEASGRQAVRLTAAGQNIQFKLTAPAQGLVVRYSIPNTSNSAVYTTGLSLYVNGVKKPDLLLTNKYIWLYGLWTTQGGTVRWSKNPAAMPTNPHRFFDEVAVMLDASYPAGTTITLRRDTSNLNFSSAASITVDFIEAEPIPAALSKPANFASITSYGAVANDGNDDTNAMRNAIAAVKNSGGTLAGVWIPPGTFTFNNGVVGNGYNGAGTRIYLDSGVSVRGAGMWWSVLDGAFAGIYAKGGNITISDLKITARDVIRDDANGLPGIEGNLSNSTVKNVWIEHAKVGIWATQSFSQAGRVTNATIVGNRFRNLWADGINLHYGASNSLVAHNNIRNSGDDGLAMWSDTYLDSNNSFEFNTVQLPGLANGIAIYGGQNNTVKANLIEDTVDIGAGISFGTNFNPPSLSGTLTISGNKLLRTGSYHHDLRYNIGAIWGHFINSSGKLNNPSVNISKNLIQDSTYSAILIEEPSNAARISFSATRIVGAGTYGVEIRNTASGSATFSATTITGAALGSLRNNSSSFSVLGDVP